MDVEFLKYKFQDGCDGVITKTRFKIGVRHVQSFYMFLCSVVMGIMRGAIGIEVLSIVDPSRRNDSYIQIHDWNRRIQGTILSSFLFGYALMVVPAELYLRRLGDKFVITSVLLINGSLSSAMPTIVNKGGWVALCNAQFLMGMTQACVSPVNQELLSKWLPPIERRPFARLIDSGIYIGMFVALPIAGLLSETRLGWELLFYSQAMMTLSMAAIWGLLTATSPEEHQAVGDSEKEYIKEAIKSYRKKHLRRPWKRILSSKQVWAIACAHSAACALFVFYLVDMPLYLRLMGLSLKQCAQQAALPFIALYLIYLTTSPSVKWFFKSGFLAYVFDVTYLRKLVNALGAFPIVIGLTILPSINFELVYLKLAIVIGTLALLGFQYSGFLENIRDLSQNFSGTLIVITGAISSIVGATVPLITGFVIGNDSDNLRSWRILFTTYGSLYACCNIVYTLLSTGCRAEWDDVDKYKCGYHNSIIGYEDNNHLELGEIKDKEGIAEKL